MMIYLKEGFFLSSLGRVITIGGNMENGSKAVTEQIHHKPSAAEKVVGIIFAFLVFALVAVVILGDINVDKGKMNLLYVLIALMAGIFAATIPGFMNMDYSTKGLTLRAAGGAAAFVFVLFVLKPIDSKSEPKASNAIFNATSYCSMRNVYGYANHEDVTTAQDLAVRNCINNGGIPNCCSSNVRVNQAPK